MLGDPTSNGGRSSHPGAQRQSTTSSDTPPLSSHMGETDELLESSMVLYAESPFDEQTNTLGHVRQQLHAQTGNDTNSMRSTRAEERLPSLSARMLEVESFLNVNLGVAKGSKNALIADRYFMGELLGSGMYGEVYSGFDVMAGIPVAIKKVFAKDPSERGKMRHLTTSELREILCLGSLKECRYIVK